MTEHTDCRGGAVLHCLLSRLSRDQFSPLLQAIDQETSLTVWWELEWWASLTVSHLSGWNELSIPSKITIDHAGVDSGKARAWRLRWKSIKYCYNRKKMWLLQSIYSMDLLALPSHFTRGVYVIRFKGWFSHDMLYSDTLTGYSFDWLNL